MTLLYEYVKLTGKTQSKTTRYGHFKCDACDQEFDRRMKLQERLKNFCSVKCINRGRKHSKDWKIMMSIRNSGSCNPYFGQHHNDEIRQKMSDKATLAWTRPEYRKTQHDRLTQQTGENNPFYGRKHSEKTKLLLSEIRSRKIANGEIRSGPRGRQGIYTSTKTSIVERYDSFFELLRMRLLDADLNVMSWTKRHGICIPYVIENRQRMYVPDFLVNLRDGSTRLEEVKGYEEETKRLLKMDALDKFCKSRSWHLLYLRFDDLESLANQSFGSSIASLRKKEFQT